MDTSVVPNTFIDKYFFDDPKNKFLFNYKYDYIDPTNYTSYKIRNQNDDISVKQFSIISRDNTAYIKNVNENNLYINSLPNNFHYISFNSTINVATNYNNIIVKFDLLRTKFNICLNDIFVRNYLPNTWIEKELNIPSEFIDISITDVEDTTYSHYIHGNNKTTLKLSIPLPNTIKNAFEIESYDLLYIIDDLNNMLWNQYDYPWIDPKYNKRVGRLLFLFAIQEKAVNFKIIHRLYKIIEDINNYLNNGRTLTYLNKVILLCKFNDSNTYLTNFASVLNNLHNNGMSFNEYIFYHDNIIKPSHLAKMFNKIIFLFLIYELNISNKNEAVNLINIYRKGFNYYDYTMAEYDNFIVEIRNFFTNIKHLLELKIIPALIILRNNLPAIII